MATTQEAIARLRMIFETQGADAAAAEMKKLEASSTSLGTSSLNLERAFTGLERRYSETARATAEYERSMRTLNAAVAQNPALAERAAAVQQTIAARYQATMQATRQATQAQTAYGQVSQSLAAQAQGLAASTGLLGSTLSTLGRAGTVAAVGLGGLYLAYQKLDEGVTKTAQYARDISHLAEATGLTTSQVQGLNKEATRFGISSEELHAGLQRFTAGFEEVRSGGGAMLDIIRKIDPALAQQAVSAGNETEALSIVGEALRRATNEFDRARLARAAFGRGGSDIALMVKDLDLGAVTDRYKDRGLSQQVIEDLKKLQSEVDARGTSISNKIYGYFGVPWLQAKNNVLAYLETVLKIGSASDEAKSNRGGALVGDTLTALRAASPLLGSMTEIVLAIAGGMTKVDNETKKAVTDQERLADAFKQTQAEAKTAAPDPRGQVQFEMGTVAPGNYQRQLEQIQAIKAEYPGLVAQDALRLAAMDDQLRAAQAVTGVQRLQVQQQVAYTQLVRQGVEPELAMTMAKKQTAIAQAQINAQAQQQLINMRNQAGVAAAVTGQDKIRAQQQATINSLLQQGVDLETAKKIAAQEQANAVASVNAAVEKQVFSLNQSTELIRAQIKDLQAQAGSAEKILGINEMNVRAQQAYTNAIREGANEEAAAAAAAATYNNLLAQRAMQQAQAAQARKRADTSIEADAAAEQANAQFNQKMKSAQTSAQQEAYQQIKSLAQAGSHIAQNYLSQIVESGYGASVLFSPAEMMPTIQAAMGEVARLPQHQRNLQALDQLTSLQNEFRVGAAATPQEKAQIEAQITYENLLKEGVSATVAQQIANQQLANAMQELAKSVDANTTALQAQLDPIYTEGRAALRIGYYGEGSGGTMRTVTGTGYANDNTARAGGGDVYAGRAYMIGERGPELFVPGASGTIVPNAALRGGDATPTGNVIIINNNFPPGAVLGDRRTQYQAANSYGRAIKAVG